jgi:hypothetical protein
VSIPRFLIVALICATPAILIWGGLITQSVIMGILAVALAITAAAQRPGETSFLLTGIRLPLAISAVPALWITLQTLPLGVFAHPIWSSAAAALKHPIVGSMSINPGASVIALGQYLLMIAVAFLSAASSVDRQRAESILFALTAAVAAIALLLLANDWFFTGIWLGDFARQQAVDCAAIGIIIASAACLRTVERYETRHGKPQRSVAVLERTFIICGIALLICLAAVLVGLTRHVLFAAGYGLLALLSAMAIRRYGLGMLGITGIALPALAAAVLLVAAQPGERGKSIVLAFAATSPAQTAMSQRLLNDAPLVGTGAGTFAALAPVYREMNDPPIPSAATTAAAFAIELGSPMLWLIVAAVTAAFVMLLRSALRRGRDSFYPAMGGGCLLTGLLLGFSDPGFLGIAASLLMAAVLGLSLAQSRSRTAP